MQSTDIPVKFPIPFANGAGPAFIRDIPTASQIGIDDGAASLTDGFPPLNFQPIASGGIPPAGEDFNGVLFRVTGWARWISAGGPVTFDAALSAIIGGYPRGAFLQSALTPGLFFVSTVENNTTDPDSGGSANWTAAIPSKASGAQVLAGTDDVRFVTPLGLAGLRASSGEVTAGVDTQKYITPAALAAAATSTPGTPGLFKLPGGIIVAWGSIRTTYTSEGARSFSFPVPFPNACWNLSLTAYNGTGGNNRDMIPQLLAGLSPTGFNVYMNRPGDGSSNIDGFDWIAVGN